MSQRQLNSALWKEHDRRARLNNPRKRQWWLRMNDRGWLWIDCSYWRGKTTGKTLDEITGKTLGKTLWPRSGKFAYLTYPPDRPFVPTSFERTHSCVFFSFYSLYTVLLDCNQWNCMLSDYFPRLLNPFIEKKALRPPQITLLSRWDKIIGSRTRNSPSGLKACSLISKSSYKDAESWTLIRGNHRLWAWQTTAVTVAFWRQENDYDTPH